MAWSVGEKKDQAKGTARSRVVELRSQAEKPGGEPAGEAVAKTDLSIERDLASGMEILELDFLLSVIENTEGDDKNDVTMRKLGFNELLRREQLDAIDSKALKAYAVNAGNLYGKNIQCEAMKKLTERTTRKSKGSG